MENFTAMADFAAIFWQDIMFITFAPSSFNLNCFCTESVADLRGARGTRAPPGPKFLHFHAVFGKNWPNNRLAPPPGLGAPSSGKSWIRHCLCHFLGQILLVARYSHLSGWFAVFAPKFWARGGDLQWPFAAPWMQMGWGSYLQVVGTGNHYLLSLNFFDLEVVGILKPSITCPLLPLPPGVQWRGLAPSCPRESEPQKKQYTLTVLEYYISHRGFKFKMLD